MDELIFDLLPKDSGHLITIELSYWVFDFDLLGCEAVVEESLAYASKMSGNHLSLLKDIINFKDSNIFLCKFYIYKN